MSALIFEETEFRWDADRFAMAFVAYDGSKRVLCMISGEALLHHFGAKEVSGGMEAAFVANVSKIEAKARELYRAGRVDESGRVLLRSADFS